MSCEGQNTGDEGIGARNRKPLGKRRPVKEERRMHIADRICRNVMIQAEKAQQRLAWLTDPEIMSIRIYQIIGRKLDMESMAQCLTKGRWMTLEIKIWRDTLCIQTT